MKTKLIFSILLFSLLSCGSVASMKNHFDTEAYSKNEILTYEYPSTRDKMIKAIKIVFEESKIKLQEIYVTKRNTTLLIGYNPASFWSYGEFIGVEIVPKDDKNVYSVVVTERRLKTNITAKNWNHEIHEKLKILYSN